MYTDHDIFKYIKRYVFACMCSVCYPKESFSDIFSGCALVQIILLLGYNNNNNDNNTTTTTTTTTTNNNNYYYYCNYTGYIKEVVK